MIYFTSVQCTRILICNCKRRNYSFKDKNGCLKFKTCLCIFFYVRSHVYFPHVLLKIFTSSLVSASSESAWQMNNPLTAHLCQAIGRPKKARTQGAIRNRFLRGHRACHFLFLVAKMKGGLRDDVMHLSIVSTKLVWNEFFAFLKIYKCTGLQIHRTTDQMVSPSLHLVKTYWYPFRILNKNWQMMIHVWKGVSKVYMTALIFFLTRLSTSLRH